MLFCGKMGCGNISFSLLKAQQGLLHLAIFLNSMRDPRPQKKKKTGRANPRKWFGECLRKENKTTRATTIRQRESSVWVAQNKFPYEFDEWWTGTVWNRRKMQGIQWNSLHRIRWMVNCSEPKEKLQGNYLIELGIVCCVEIADKRGWLVSCCRRRPYVDLFPRAEPTANDKII